jgi:hypothetical protein
MKYLCLLIYFLCFTLSAAYQYNVKGNQGWITFDSETTLSFELDRSGKDKDHQNFIDKGEGISDYGWYNLDSGESGSFNNGLTASFKENDKIGLYVTDNKGNTYLSTKPKKPFEDDIWGKSKLVDGALTIGGGNFGSNGTHEYYVFKINSVNNTNNKPTGQPLSGIIATLIFGIVILFYLKHRKKLLTC